MENDRNRNSVLRQLAALKQMSQTELKEKWRDLYGEESPDLLRSLLMKRLAYRIQEIYYGGLTKTDTDKIERINKSINSKNQCSTCNILPGTRFIREWNGQEYVAIARDDGFEYQGRLFNSLSAVANEITGTRWNGLVFFGLKKRKVKA